MLLTLLSGIFGGLLRLAPELLKWLDRKDDRAHELAMQDKQMQFLQLTGKQKLDEIGAQGQITLDEATIKAISEVNQSQDAAATAAGGFAATLSALVRPIITFWVFGMWSCYKLAVMVYAFNATGDLVGTLVNSWGPDDAALLSMVTSFYFVGRVWERKNRG